jgi:hypothetical protein
MKLRQDCFIGRYRHVERDPEKLMTRFANRFEKIFAYWGFTGAAGAKILTGYIQPDAVALFVDEAAHRTLKDERMLPDPKEGNVVLFDTFARNAIIPQKPFKTATPLLVYAELLNDGRPREVETAQMIYERFIAPAEVARER